MRYISTRDSARQHPKQFCDILLEGLAPDGGLYLPEEYPQLSAAVLAGWRRLLVEEGYAAVAAEVLQLFISDISPAELRKLCERAYASHKFLDPTIVPITKLSDGIRLVHLSNGPTAAFKDMAMQLLGELFEFELERRDERLTILGATSGDTGSAAEYALRGKERITVFMLSPAGRMTPFQQAQMFSLDEPNIVNIAVDGVFDDCQDLVKQLNADADFKAEHRLGAVNSINWARLLAQVVYYIVAWLQIADDREEISFAVPSGNFGNIAAGHIARQMGLPIAQLVLATNENNVLDEFFRTGNYRVRAASETLETSSPSMDISKASNFERFVFDLVERDGARVAELFAEVLPADQAFDLSQLPKFETNAFGFVSGSSTHVDRVAQIQATYQIDQVVVDPHTADGLQVARELGLPGKVAVLETALPVKFAATIVEALGFEPPRPAVFVGIEDLPRHVTGVPNSAEAVREIIEQRAQ